MKQVKLAQATDILRSLGLPRAQQNDRSALTLLALAHVRPGDAWKDARRPLLRIWDIMAFIRTEYGRNYAANTRETIRRQTVHQFEQARIVDRNPDNPARPTNSGRNVYALTAEAWELLRRYGTGRFGTSVAEFIRKHGTLQEAYRGGRASLRVPLRLPDGSTQYLSPGAHNRLQVAVIHEFGPRFAPGARLLYLGDTERKLVVCDALRLAQLKINIAKHEKSPDILLYDPTRRWLFVIEAVTTHGPVSPKRHREIEKLLMKCSADRVYVTAFRDLASFRKHAADIAWETEVWIADDPDHMIHFNGPKFLGPFKSKRL